MFAFRRSVTLNVFTLLRNQIKTIIIHIHLMLMRNLRWFVVFPPPWVVLFQLILIVLLIFWIILADSGVAVSYSWRIQVRLLPLNHTKASVFTISDGLSSVHFSEMYQIYVYFVEIGHFLTKSLGALLVGQHLFLCCFLKLIYFMKTLLSKGKSVRLYLFWMEIVMMFLIKNAYSYWKFMFYDC